mgnify:FL=1
MIAWKIVKQIANAPGAYEENNLMDSYPGKIEIVNPELEGC